MEWFEDESFWRDFYPYMFDEARWDKAPGQVESILRLAGIDRGEVLDLCCGPGRHSVALAKKGFGVTGVDRSEFLLERARQHAEGSTVELIQSDARDFVRENAFDMVVNLFTSFGYFATRDEDLRMLRNAWRSLKPGGVLVMDLHGTETIALPKTPTVWREDPQGKVVIMHSQPLDDWQRMRNSWVVLDGERARRFEFTLNLYSGAGLTKMLETAGFGDIKLFGSLDGTPYDATATRLVAVARRL
jgi:SAM-dependent methyltransferase